MRNSRGLFDRQRVRQGAPRRVAARFQAASVGAKNTTVPRGLCPNSAADAVPLTYYGVMLMSP